MKNTSSGVEQEYRDREEGQSSTSKYIQVKVPPAGQDDGYKAKPVGGTPDDKIIKPNLKTAKCDTVDFELPSGLLALIPVPLPFLKKKSSKEIKEKLPDKEKSEYGKIVVNETKGGFVNIQDETAGNKRWQKLHPSGTYQQVVDNGDYHDKVVHDRYIIVDKNWNISIGEDWIEVVSGNNKIQIKKNSSININGNESVNVDGNSNVNIVGNEGLQVGGNHSESITGNFTTEVGGNHAETIKGYRKTMVSGNENNTIMGTETDVICGSWNVTVSGSIMLSSSASITLVAPVINLKGKVNMN
jgi:Gp5 C-terminal repeat (3 copies)